MFADIHIHPILCAEWRLENLPIHLEVIFPPGCGMKPLRYWWTLELRVGESDPLKASVVILNLAYR